MSLAKDDHMVETIPADATDHAFGIRILPGRVWRGFDLFDAHVLNAPAEVLAVDSVAVAQKEPWRRIVGERLNDLLGRPPIGPWGSRLR